MNAALTNLVMMIKTKLKNIPAKEWNSFLDSLKKDEPPQNGEKDEDKDLVN